MPCGATSNLDYPDYIKRMLKVINVGNDDELKACACSLKTPLTSEGCPVTDQNGKVAIFPECVQVGVGKLGGGVFSLDHFMKMYWRAKEFKFSISGKIYVNWPFPPDEVDGIPGLFPFEYNNIILPKFNYVEDFEGVNPIVNEEQMVCGVIYYTEEHVLPGNEGAAELTGVVATSNDLNDPATLFNFSPGDWFEIDAGFEVYSANLYVSLGSESDLTFPFIEGPINFGGVEVPSRLYVSFGLNYLFMDASQSSFTASFEVTKYY